MSKMTLIDTIVRDVCEADQPDYDGENVVVIDITDLRIILGNHLAAQAEWPSEEDVERAVDARIALMCDRGKENCSNNDLMRAALQSVRPPMLANSRVPDEEIWKIAESVGAELDGGESPDYQAGDPGTPPSIFFTDKQLLNFVDAMLAAAPKRGEG